MDAKQVVLAFWQEMQSNDFEKASLWLSEDFEGIWPQSNERVLGRDNFTAINTQYPANGRWHFQINSVVCEMAQVVTDVSITDGVQKARAITFHTVSGGRICKQIEFWPDDYDAPEWRAKWVMKSQKGESS
ncbi:nuclear transport factor 2 family protein [Vibrio tapetis subsp. quintayensis]|uniref:nuclear transport factor 2 family protein n=1 Tax=Vibrio tapetis TaxID=52443 RepID=UPI0025B30F02|nr:nuclear transport factor 2 family protein [Vibrio tapetis]MDN3681305.1 nuclear transport factor 2 family protein [Vibrio tapetis subsp. quintayensis]